MKEWEDGRSYIDDVQADVSRKENKVREKRMSECMSKEGGSLEEIRVKGDRQEGLARI